MTTRQESFFKGVFSVVPFLWALFCVSLNFVNVSFLPVYHQSFPVILIVIFYFAVFSPQKLNIFMVFFLGIFADILAMAPFGLHSFAFCLMFFISNLIRSYIHSLPFIQLWGVFCVLFLATDILLDWLFRLVSGSWVPASFWFVQYLFICLLYPCFMWMTGFLMKKIRTF